MMNDELPEPLPRFIIHHSSFIICFMSLLRFFIENRGEVLQLVLQHLLLV